MVSHHEDEVNNKENIYKEVEKDNVKSEKNEWYEELKSIEWRGISEFWKRKEDGKAQQDDDTWHPLARHPSSPSLKSRSMLTFSWAWNKLTKHIPLGRKKIGSVYCIPNRDHCVIINISEALLTPSLSSAALLVCKFFLQTGIWQYLLQNDWYRGGPVS